METNFFDRLLFFLSEGFYMPIVLLTTATYSTCKIWKGSSIFKQEFLIYLISIFVLFIGGFVLFASQVISTRDTVKAIEIANIVFNAIEAIVFCTFFQKVFNENKITKILQLSKFIIAIYCTITLEYHAMRSVRMDNVGYYYTTTNFYFIVICSLYYFYDVYKKNKLFEPPIVFITLAVFSYGIFSIPYFSLAGNMNTDYIAVKLFYSVHYLLLSILCWTLSLSVHQTKSPDSQLLPT